MNIPQEGLDKKMFQEINFTEVIFSRMNVDRKIVRKLVLAIKDGDIYNQTPAYPDPNHRSFALSNQAAMLYILLFFIPDFMKTENSKMREICDKHFYDNWVTPIFMGYVVDLTNEWQAYEACKQAIELTINPKLIRSNAEKKKKKTKLIIKSLSEEYLPEGILTNDLVLENLDSLLNLLRDGNT